MNREVLKALEPLNIPVEFQKYTGGKQPYITFFTYLEQGELFADNEEIETGYYIHLDLFGKGNLQKIAKDIKRLMRENGFTRTSNFDATYEKDTGLHHKVFRFYKTKVEE